MRSYLPNLCVLFSHRTLIPLLLGLTWGWEFIATRDNLSLSQTSVTVLPMMKLNPEFLQHLIISPARVLWRPAEEFKCVIHLKIVQMCEHSLFSPVYILFQFSFMCPDSWITYHFYDSFSEFLFQSLGTPKIPDVDQWFYIEQS